MRIKGVPTMKSKSNIPLRVLLYIAWKNLMSKKLRSFLTVFGVVIGVSAIFFLLSFGLGLRDLVANQVIGDKSIKAIEVSTNNSKIIKLDDKVYSKISSFPHVMATGKLFSYPGTVKNNSGYLDAVTYGVDEDYQDLGGISLLTGRQLTDDDGYFVLLNSLALEALNISKESALGQKVEISISLFGQEADVEEIKSSFEIAGIVDKGSGIEVYVPSRLFEMAGVPVYSQIKVLSDDVDNVSALRKQIEAQGLETSSPVDTLDQINQVFKYFTVILVGFGAIGMTVAVLGMFNTLTISLLERTKEIGLMIALGGRGKDMRMLFIIEAALLSFIGAVIGIVLAVVSGFIVNLLMNQMASNRGVTESFNLFSSPLWVIFSLIIFMMAVGMLVVFYPARRAQKINPIETLRRE